MAAPLFAEIELVTRPGAPMTDCLDWLIEHHLLTSSMDCPSPLSIRVRTIEDIRSISTQQTTDYLEQNTPTLYNIIANLVLLQSLQCYSPQLQTTGADEAPKRNRRQLIKTTYSLPSLPPKHSSSNRVGRNDETSYSCKCQCGHQSEYPPKYNNRIGHWAEVMRNYRVNNVATEDNRPEATCTVQELIVHDTEETLSEVPLHKMMNF
ncbi:hypothetical protein Bbelb_049160 [Branchiostoma belcheri]|nr:hypothetical protein Bbelb_049160 [Branchiostoma belcheri]